MNILLGVTGSVAATLAGKLAVKLQMNGKHDVKIVITESTKPFLKGFLYETGGHICPIDDRRDGPWSRSYLQIVNGNFRQNKKTGKLIPTLSTFSVFTDKDEWTWEDSEVFKNRDQLEIKGDMPEIEVSFQKWIKYHDRPHYKKEDPILHIDLRKWADVFVIAPVSANTLAKMTYGMCDNLLTSIYRAWDWSKEVVVAPAMNTFMWSNAPTAEQIRGLKERGVKVVPPMNKELACGDVGDGAMAMIDDIVAKVNEALVWAFPLDGYN